jgi:transcriptional regulator with XRE-family HTH domain
MTRASRRMANKRLQRDPRREVLRKLGEKVRALRHERGLTQEALAETLDLSVAYVSLIERGGRNPPYTTVVAIAHALGVSAGDICD